MLVDIGPRRRLGGGSRQAAPGAVPHQASSTPRLARSPSCRRALRRRQRRASESQPRACGLAA
eukprot:14833100-Heterocapsa_arctica.AAC.1